MSFCERGQQADIFQTADRKHSGSTDFRRFRRQLFHSSIGAIFEKMRPAMEKPIVTRCADGHYRRVIYGFGPYIADYPEQVLLPCVVQDWCPRYVLISVRLCYLLTLSRW